MKRTALPTLIGVFTSLFAIWFVHSYFIIDDCIANNGAYNHSTGQCLLESGQIHESAIASFVLLLYFIIGFAVAFVVSHLIRKFFNMSK